MTTPSIYGPYEETLKKIQTELITSIQAYNQQEIDTHGEAAYEHLIYRIKGNDSMQEKCSRKGLPVTAETALVDIHDAIGIRIVCRFIDDIYMNIRHIQDIPGVEIIKQKDYIKNAKENGYRSYHMIIKLTVPYEDVLGHNPGTYFAEVQIRTIAMDTWASLEHQLKYKQHITNTALIVRELKRCADELAACDVSMQTIRNLIHADQEKA